MFQSLSSGLPELPSKIHSVSVGSLLLYARYVVATGAGSVICLLRLQQVSWRSFFQAPTPGLLQWLDIPSYLQGGVLTVLLIANIIVISLHARTWADVQKRAGCLAVTHLVPLCSGFSFSLPAHVYYVERDTFYWAHRWLGRICVLHCLLHGSVLGANARNTSLGAPIAIPLLVSLLKCQREVFISPGIAGVMGATVGLGFEP